MDAIQEEIYDQDLPKAFVPQDSSAGVQPDYYDPNTLSARTISQASVSGFEGSDDEDGGVSLNGAIRGLNLNSSVSTNTLIDTSDDRQRTVTGTNAWSVASGSRKTPSVFSAKTNSTFGSNVRNKSDQDFKVGSSGFAKIRAYVSPFRFCDVPKLMS